MKCLVCENSLVFRWTDTHGVGVCNTCGAPYTVYHYEDKNRVDKPPEIALIDEGVTLAKRYWSEKSSRVFPGVYDMGMLGGRSTTYSGATQSEINEFGDWYNEQPENKARAAIG